MSLVTLLVVLAILVTLFVVEKLFPLRESRAGLLARLVVNGCMSALAFVVAAAVVRPAAMHTLDWASERPFGLLHVVRLPGWAQFAVGFLLLDLFFYYWHLLNHRIPLLWRFHNVHHIDPALGYSSPADNTVWRAITMPFIRQRDYWRKPDGSMPERRDASLENRRNELAE